MSYTLDAVGRPMQITDSIGGTITNAYDTLDRLTSQTTALGTVSYQYDVMGRRTQMTVPNQSPVTYAYDAASRVTLITQGSNVVQFAYDAASRRSTLTLPNSISTQYGYDAASQLTALTYKLGGTTLGDLQYTYDAARNRIQVGGSWARTGVPQAVPSATYNANNQQLTFGGQTLTYDLNGNLTSDGTNTYTWDARNRLAAVTGSPPATFIYDALGRRSRKTINGATTDFLYDMPNPVQEQSGSTVTNLLTALGVDEYLSRGDASSTSFFLADALGSTIALADSSASIPTGYTYEPFGATSTTGAATSNPYDFTGRETELTGLKYYRARYYHPTLQRFVSEDPAGLAAGTNLYVYVDNDPINFIDPDGRIAVQIIGGVIGAGFGAYAAYTTGGNVLQSALVGAGAGVLSTIPIPGVNPVLGSLVASGTAGFLGNVATQVLEGTSLRCVNLTSAGLSAIAGAAGGAIGARVASMTQPRFLAPSAAGRGPILTQYGQSVFGAIMGGVIGGVGDAVLQKTLSGRSCGCSQ